MENAIEKTGANSLVPIVHQVKMMLSHLVPFKLISTADRMGFMGEHMGGSTADGILSIKAILTEDTQHLKVSIGLVKGLADSMLSALVLFDYLSSLGEKAYIVKFSDDEYGLALRIRMEPLTITRINHLKSTLEIIIEFAKYLQEQAGSSKKNTPLEELYKDIRSNVEPVYPYVISMDGKEVGILRKAYEAIRILESGFCVAVSCEQTSLYELFLAIIADNLKNRAVNTLGINTEVLPIKSIMEINSKSPGYLGIRSLSLAFATGAYERSDEIDLFLSLISKEKKPILFYGPYSEHQTVFGAGQGKAANPLKPTVITLEISDVELEDLIQFELKQELSKSGFTDKAKAEYTRLNLINYFEEGTIKNEEIHLLRPVIKCMLNEKDDPLDILKLLRTRKKTFRGLSGGVLPGRTKDVQQKLITGIEKGTLQEFVSTRLIGQDYAINLAISRLWKEVLTRPLKQPIRMILQGVAGVGKSEFSQIVAEYLDIPYVSIDASSFTDIHQASSMLVGSGRGIVQSYLPGKLEVIAKNNSPVCCEIADLDHASPNIRGFLADLFLNVMEKGEVQTANGEKISANNIILFFTINLPGGKDEQVTKGMGFNSILSYDDILMKTTKEIKAMFSTAFVSRVSEPIIFRSFNEEEQASILELALKKKLSTCMTNLGIERASHEILVGPGTGRILMNQKKLDGSLGARIIYDIAGELITNAVLGNIEFIKTLDSSPVTIKAADEKSIKIIT